MVIATSDSTNTLVSLDNAIKRVSSLEGLQINNKSQSVAFRETSIYLPEDGFCLENDEVPIYLPQDGARVGADECLGCLPQVMDARDELLAKKPVHFTRASPERILYVGQGEVAHAVAQQCDVIVSDRATTCHILAFRSTSDVADPLSSLTHIDAASYDVCVRQMVEQHRIHHGTHQVELSVHILGGYQDSQSASRKISNWLIHLLADIAEEEQNWMRMTLRDCAITSLNDSGFSSPLGRGLALDLRTGDAFLASCNANVMGPRQTLRSARLWSQSTTPQLSLIHDQQSSTLSITPFEYSPFEGLDRLLSFSDDVLLQYTSTSPECEEEGFCSSVRSTLTLVRDVPCRVVFVGGRPLTYQRIGTTNTWKVVRSF